MDRLARLEGAYERIDRRLADLRQELVDRFSGVDQRFVSIDQHFANVEQRLSSLEVHVDSGFERMDQKFMWLIGIIVGTWITTILAVLFHR